MYTAAAIASVHVQRSNLAAFGVGVLVAWTSFVVAYFIKVSREMDAVTPSERGSAWSMFVFSVISFTIQGVPLLLGAGLFAILVMHLAIWVGRLLR